jgi:hypothetical protein
VQAIAAQMPGRRGQGGVMPDKARQLLVVLRFEDYGVARLANLVPQLANVLAEMSAVKPEIAFHSHARDLVGYVIVSRLSPARVRAAIESSGRLPGGSPSDSVMFSLGSDSVMVLEMSGPTLVGQALAPTSGQPPR